VKVFRSLEQLKSIRNPVVTTGSFDGVHVGHKTIINRLSRLAKEVNGESALITFHPHPRRVLYPNTQGKDLLLINTQREKIEMLRKAGLDNVIILEFTLEFAQTSSIDFVRKILVDALHAKRIVVGFNHFFGHNREGNYEFLHELGEYYNFKVEEIPEQDIHNEAVSSTKIRKAIFDGDIQKANAYLDHHYIIMGQLSKSDPLLYKIGFPGYLVKSEEDSKLYPPTGLYAINAEVEGDFFKGMCFIRRAENALDTLVDVQLFDAPDNLLGRNVMLYFYKFIRGERQISGETELQSQLRIDKQVIDDLIY